MPHYNKGQLYEVRIRDLLYKRGILPAELHGNDAGFIHHGKPYFLEIKNRKAPDYGQKKFSWSKEMGWHWINKNIVSDMFDSIGALDYVNPNFVPRRYSKPQENISLEDKVYDQQNIKKSGIPVNDVHTLYEFYKRKDCYYIQIEGFGFYYLDSDIANLGVPQFSPELTLRLRAKTHDKTPIYNYSFLAVINAKKRKYSKSDFDLEEIVGQFPQII